MIAALPVQSWRTLSAGKGAKGDRVYDWARVRVHGVNFPDSVYWLLARRSLSDPTDLAYYLCHAPARSRLAELVTVAGTRWAIEETFQTSKGQTGLDHYQVRQYTGWYPHITLSMLALAWLAATRAQAAKGETGPSSPGMIGYTLPEIRRLLTGLAWRYLPDPEQVLAWSNWRRKRQYPARASHYRRRGYTLT